MRSAYKARDMLRRATRQAAAALYRLAAVLSADSAVQRPGCISGVNTLGPNDLGVAPAGIGHFIKNAGPALVSASAAIHTCMQFLSVLSNTH